MSSPANQPAVDTGPDPVWGIGIGMFGLLLMGIGGAVTHHYLFNIGEVFMGLGGALFLSAVALSWNRRRRAKDRESPSGDAG